MANHEPSNWRQGDRVDLVDAPVIASGRRLAGRYRLERPLGHGGMAAVWLATDERLDRPVAIKVLSDTLAGDDEYLVRFRREARVAARLQHPNLVGVYDFDAGARPYLVMEYVPGGDLASRVEAGHVPEPERLARELLLALRHIHAAGVLHRDIKPQNVLIDADGRARLTDFGIAQPHDATSLTRTGHVIGTERYIGPEVMAGEPATERSDLFALGVVLADVAQQHGAGALRSLTARLRDPDPARRPQSASAALAVLEREPAAGATTQPYAMEDAPITEPLSGPTPPRRPFEPTPTRRARRARRWAIAGLAAVALAGGVAIAIGLGAGDDSGSPSRQAANRETGERAQGGGDREDSAAPAAPKGDAASAPSGDGAAVSSDASGAPAASDSSSSGAPETDGPSLNDQGYQLVQEGSYEEAIPVLERAVNELGGSGDELTYNYALYNLGTAYLGAGRPADAIPVLEERMQFDDGQLDTVQATLDEAYAAAGEAQPAGDEAAGEEPSTSEKPGNGPKPKQPNPGKGPKD